MIYLMHMVRMQLYLAATQDKGLKRRAKAIGVSEAELVRRAVDALLGLEPTPSLGTSDPTALDEILLRARSLAKRGHRLPERLDRQWLHDEREERWTR